MLVGSVERLWRCPTRDVTTSDDEDRVERAFQGGGRKRRDTGRFDVSIERIVIRPELFVMGSVPRPTGVVEREHQSR